MTGLHANTPRVTVLFEKSKITAIGAEVKVPADAIVVDVKGLHVYPGLIEPFSNLGSIRATVDDQEIGTINSEVRAEKALNPDSERFPVTRANGVALAAVLAGGAEAAEAGKEATLMVTDGDPLEVTTQVEKLYIQGRPVDLDTRQKALYRKYREKYRRLGEQE